MRWLRRPKSGPPTFENRAFWNSRYRTDPCLGSGVGSRGELAALKREFVEQAWREAGEGSLLDVGFGDLKVLDLSRFHTYTGVDVSDIAVEMAQQRYPNHRFLQADFAGEVEPAAPDADMVVCLDVLIHQLDPEGYQRMVRRLVQHSRGHGLVSGYDHTPDAEFASEITAFHEPLSSTLSRAGARDLTIVGEYRGLSAIRFRTGTTAAD